MFAVIMLALLGVTSMAATEIEFHFVANQSEANAWFELADMFNSIQDDVHVVANWDTGEWIGYQERMLVRIAAGESPDIMRLSDEAFPDWANNGYLRTLDAWLARDVDLSEYLPPTALLGSHGGAFYGFPQGLATRAIAYNRSMFDAAGVDYPHASWRWDGELLEAARKLTTRTDDDQPLTYGIGFHNGGSNALRKDFPEIIWSFGGELFDADGNMRLGDNDSLLGLNFVQSLVAEHRVYPEDFDIVGRFLNETLAMWNTGVWDVGLLRQQTSLDFDFAPPPSGPGGEFAFIQGNGVYVIPSTTSDERAAAAWEFMKFLASDDAQRLFGLEYGIGGVPLRINLVPDYVAQASPPDSWDAFVTSVNRGRMVHNPKRANDVYAALNVGWAEMRTGGISVRAWFESVQPIVQSILDSAE